MFLEITSQISKPNIFELFKFQLKKDFEYSNLDTSFIDDLIADYTQITDVLEIVLKDLITKSTHKLNELLYRIDISESQIKNLSKAKPQQKFVATLSELIFKRILQKVVIKEYHKIKNIKNS